MKNKTLLLLFIVSYLQLHAQSDNYLSGAKSKAFADASSTFTDHWAGINNQAGLAFLENTAVGVFAENRFGLKELNSGAITFALPTSQAGSLGINLYTFNQSTIFNRQKLGLAYAIKFSSHFAAGLQLNLIRTFIEEYGNSMAFWRDIEKNNFTYIVFTYIKLS